MNGKDFFGAFIPRPTPATLAEKLRSGAAGGAAILLLGLLLQYAAQYGFPPLMLGSIAASAVLLFAAPHSPMAQPWNLVGGHLVSGLAGWGCALLVTDPFAAAGAAVGLSILLMYLLNCLHPPGAATALTLVLGGTSSMAWQSAPFVVAANAGLFLLLALLINNLLPGRSYPAHRLPPAAPRPGPFITLERGDIETALAEMDSVIDASPEDLAEIYQRALEHAQDRMEDTRAR